MTDRVYDIPTSAVAEKGIVLLDGPGGLAITLTPDAAHRSADAIEAAAREAGEQRAAASQR